MKKKGTKKGFTLIELSFAILFISTLMVTLALITMEIISIYRKGYAIKTVNAVGRDLIDDFTASVSEAPSKSVSNFCKRFVDATAKSACEDGNGMYSVRQQFVTPVQLKKSDGTFGTSYYPYGGLFCTGKYSYIYQTGFVKNPEIYEISDGEIQGIRFDYNDSTSTTDFTLLKISDPKRSLCANNINEDSYTLRSNTTTDHRYRIIEMPDPIDEPTELLSKSDNALAIFNFDVASPAETTSTGRSFYSASFILATISGGVDIKTNGNYCTAPIGFSADFSYCAINRFNFSIQANGGK